MIRSDRVLDPALQELKMIKLLLNNKYKADFAEFAVAWIIPVNVNRAKSAKKTQNYADSANFDNFYCWVYRNLRNKHEVREFCIVLDKGW